LGSTVLAITTIVFELEQTRRDYIPHFTEVKDYYLCHIAALYSGMQYPQERHSENPGYQQLQESWQGTWTAQDITVDTKDRYTIRVLGRQDIHRLDNGANSR
jgi:hypothetical protein